MQHAQLIDRRSGPSGISPHTYDNAHNWASDIIRVRHIGDGNGYGGPVFIRIRSTASNMVQLTSYTENGCGIDCSMCPNVGGTGERGECRCAISSCPLHPDNAR